MMLVGVVVVGAVLLLGCIDSALRCTLASQLNGEGASDQMQKRHSSCDERHPYVPVQLPAHCLKHCVH